MLFFVNTFFFGIFFISFLFSFFPFVGLLFWLNSCTQACVCKERGGLFGSFMRNPVPKSSVVDECFFSPVDVQKGDREKQKKAELVLIILVLLVQPRP